jgi:hypothetical protein
MADVSGKFYSATKVRTGVSPSSPGVEVGETLPPVNPPGSDLNSVGLTMPAAFNVANSPLTSNGTIAVTGAGTTAQYIRGDGTLASFPSLTGYVPYTGATADVDLGTHDLTAERGTFQNNGSSDTLTVNHTSGSGYGIKVTKGGNNEALLVTKTSGSGNAMAVVGGRTSLVDLALSSVTNTAGDFLTLSGGVVHKRTAAEVRTDIGAGTVTSVAALTLGTSGTDLSSTVANGTTTPVITLNVPTASATNRGALSSADWATFNAKENAITAGTTAQYFRGDKTFQTLNTSVVPELTNLYYTDGRARGALSFAAGSGAYNTSTGVITIPTNNNQITNGAGYITSAALGAYLPLAGGTMTGAILMGSSVAAASDSQPTALSYGLLQGFGTFTLAADTDGTTSEFAVITSGYGIANATPANGLAVGFNTLTWKNNVVWHAGNITPITSVTASSPLFSSGGTTPNITIQQASGSANGALSSTDWTTFNNKQNALTNPVTGTGNTNYLSKFPSNGSTIGNSQIIDDGTRVGIGVSPTTNKLEVGGSITVGTGVTGNTDIRFNNATNGKIHYVFSDALSGDLGIEAGASVGIKFNTNGANTRMAIFSDGNVTIGNSPSNAAFKLDVNGTGRFSDTVSIIANNSNAYALNLLGRSVDNATTLNFFSNNGATRYGFIYTEPTNMQFGVNGAVRLTIASTGAATFSRNDSANISLTISNSFISQGNLINFIHNSGGTTTNAFIGHGGDSSGNLIFINNSIQALTIERATGAATFSSSVSATQFTGNGFPFNSILGSGADATTSTIFAGSTSGQQSSIDVAGGGAANPNSIIFKTASQTRLTISSTGFASFNSSAFNVATFSSTFGQMFITLANSGVSFGGIGSGNSVTSDGAAADDLGIGTGGLNKSIVFATGAGFSRRMTITSGGNVLIGTTTDTGNDRRLQVAGNLFVDDNATTGNGVQLKNADRPLITRGWDAFTSGNKTGVGRWGVYMESAELFIGSPGTDYTGGLVTIGGWLVDGTRQPNLTVNNQTRNVTATGSITATSFFESSDATLKTLVQDDYQVKDIESVVAKLYIKNGKQELGYFAQDLESILPSAVNKGTDGLLNLSYREVHTAKLQFLEQKIKELEAQLKNN